MASAPLSVARVLTRHQVAGAVLAERAVADMLTEQGMRVTPAAPLNPLAFTTDARVFTDMLGATDEFDRLVESLVQEATRAAESVAIAVRPTVGWVRYLNPPSCGRCAVLAGRFYKWSDGFLRHPGCDCVHVATDQDVAKGLVSDPTDLFEQGKITGLSKAETQAIRDGANVNQVVNARRNGLSTVELFGRKVKITHEGTTRRGLYGSSDFAAGAGYRADKVGRRGAVANYTKRTTNRARLSVGEIYANAKDQSDAIRLLGLYGYIR